MASEEDDAQKTEDPTPKKLEETRKKGQVALSREVNSWVMLFAATLMVGALGPYMFSSLNSVLVTYIENAHQLPSDTGGIGDLLGSTLVVILKALALPLLFLIVAAFAAPFLQIGPLFAIEAIKPDFSKVNPAKGFKRLFSMRSLMEFAKGLFKIGLVGIVGVIILYPYFDKFEHFIGLPMSLLLAEVQTLIVRLMLGVLVSFVIIAVADLVYQRYEHNKKLRMSRQEVKDEFKQTEGDPHVKSRLRQLRAERARQRMMQAVPSADVVITNPTHYAIALKYDADSMDAPLCVAKGKDDVALRIREVAKEHDIELYENKPLARALFDTVEIDEIIPAEHYKAVAEVISYVFKLKGKLN